MNWLYTIPIWPVVLAFLVLMVLAVEVGQRVASRAADIDSDRTRSARGVVKASALGLVALLLAFSFSMAEERYDARRRLVVTGANEIGTCFLRAGFLDEPARSGVRAVLRDYVNWRLELYDRGTDQEAARRARAELARLEGELWRLVEGAFRADPLPNRLFLLVQSANNVIDLGTERDAAIEDHVPTEVLLVLGACVLLSGFLMGHSLGEAKGRDRLIKGTYVVLSVAVLFMIHDLDRPRRGFIKVSQEPLRQLQAKFAANNGGAVPPAAAPQRSPGTKGPP